jgi:hypothetical protein
LEEGSLFFGLDVPETRCFLVPAACFCITLVLLLDLALTEGTEAMLVDEHLKLT